MGYSARYRPSWSDGRHLGDPVRGSTGAVNLSSSYDPYGFSESRHGYNAYQSDYPYAHSYDPRMGRERKLEAQPVSSQTYRDPGRTTKLRTEYAVRPRSSTTSGADAPRPTIRTTAPSSGTRSIPTSRYGRSPSPLPSDSQRYPVPASSRRGHQHRRDYSTDYASDTGRLVPKSAAARRRMGHGAYAMYAPRTHARYPATGGPRKAEVDDYDAYSYTNPSEQFERESMARVGHRKGGHRKVRPLSLTGIEEYHHPLAKDPRALGPPPSQRGFDKLDRESKPQRSAYGSRDDDVAEGSRQMRRYPAPVSLHDGDDDDYSSYKEDYDNSRRHRRHQPRRHDDSGGWRAHDNRELRQHHAGDPLVSDSGTGIGSPVNGFDPSPRTDLRSRDPKRYSRNKTNTRRPRSSRPPESDSDASYHEEDLRKYRHEPSARRRHSGSDSPASSQEEHPRHLTVGKPRRRRSYSRHRAEDRSPARISSRQESASAQEDPDKSITSGSPSAKEPDAPPKGILKRPRDKFPEEPNPVREGVAPLKDAHKKGIPPGARWTKIDRRLVNPAALEASQERFEERPDYVIVLRVLSKEEIQAYAVKTHEIRGTTTPHSFWRLRLMIEPDARHKEYTQDRRRRMEEGRRRGRHDESSSDDEDDDNDDADYDDDDDDTQFAIEGTAPDKGSPPRATANPPSQPGPEPAGADGM